MGLFGKNKFPHIQYGFRGEGILYKFKGKEFEIWSTWGNGRRIYLDEIYPHEKFTIEEKRIMFKDIVAFSKWKMELPIIVYTSISDDAHIWRELCIEFKDSIKSVETSTEEENLQSQYNMMKEGLEGGLATYHIDGQVLKTVKDLETYWAKKYS
ncbi:hypothetical protein KFE98_15960 [bacterium SCSIO 12741]|nr:hypothetical protein KFE98_15960 [bacterium SCSIO 12741]